MSARGNALNIEYIKKKQLKLRGNAFCLFIEFPDLTQYLTLSGYSHF